VFRDVTCVMASCRVREVARSRTIPQLRTAGLEPVVFLSPCDPAGPEQNRAVALEAMRHAATVGAPALYVEDDIDVDPLLFRWSVDLAARLDAVTYLYLNDSPARLREHFGREVAATVENRGVLVRGAYAVRERAALFGTQCVLIPVRLLGAMVGILEESGTRAKRMPWDGRLHTWLRANRNEPVFVTLPHPVQHRQDRTGRTASTRVIRSFSYGQPWVDAVDEPFVDAWHDDRRYQPVQRTRESIALAFTSRRQRQRDHQ
jgi:hypothetical protein